MGFCERCDGIGGHDEGCQFYNPNPNFIEIDFDHLTKRHFFGEKTTVRWSQELQSALEIVESKLQREMINRKTLQRNEFLANKYAELKKNEGNTSKIKEILNDMADYENVT